MKMKKLFASFIFIILITISSFGQSFIDRGYLNLKGPSVWNDYYVVYSLTTNNEKGGKARTTFEKNSSNKILELFEYDSKDMFILQSEFDNIVSKVDTFGYDCDILGDLIYYEMRDLTGYLYYKDSVENENAVSVIEEKFDWFKKQIIESYIKTKENFQKLSSEEKAILRWDDVTSSITVKFSRYTDSRSGYFIFDVFQKELNETNCFCVSDYTNVYFDVVDNEHLRSYNNLDEKTLAICSELSVNKEIVFGVLKEDSLKPYKNCGFVLIKNISE